MTHCIAASVVPRSAWIFGSATLTTDSSTNAMVDPNTAAASTQALSRPGQAHLQRVARMTCAAHGCVFELITCCRSIRVCPGAIVHLATRGDDQRSGGEDPLGLRALRTLLCRLGKCHSAPRGRPGCSRTVARGLRR